ncbi:histidinol-phosphate aminotransferase [Oleiphilus messinensis]|uniref:Histidinol-phosphate aminotransferase n=1 Tax=Oleiphilus messinensis TaxID=141451 RepID=A0A1Y0IAH6_9GAMM|nr:histidinol-phosphate transaminase [Oleiphilus messinensis]ARU57508.1 histidinol-phosphate aminotransferase [Oleiphilus messinensis]
MTCDYKALAVAGVQGLTPYTPGKPEDEVKRELGLEKIFKLASNENPLGPSPRAVQAIKDALPSISRYPDGSGYQLKQALSKFYGIDEKQITLGNGSNDVLELIVRAYAGPGDEVVFSQYAFAVYPLAAKAAGAVGVAVPAEGWGHDLNGIAAALTEKTKLVFLANPNNPTGTWFSESQLRAFLTKVPEDIVVVLDEAYCEYISEPDYPDGVALLQSHPNLIVTRTFSKAWGLAALRIGYAVSGSDIADILNRVRQPFNVDTLAQVAALASLADVDYLKQSIENNRAGMQQVTNRLQSLGVAYIDSVGNFVCIEVGDDAADIYQRLLLEGVIVRPVANYGMPRHLRVSIGLPEENEAFLNALETILFPNS